jgi:hypothetical protein
MIWENSPCRRVEMERTNPHRTLEDQCHPVFKGSAPVSPSREMLAGHADLTRRLDELERKYDQQFASVFDAIRQLMSLPRPPRSCGSASTRLGKLGSNDPDRYPASDRGHGRLLHWKVPVRAPMHSAKIALRPISNGTSQPARTGGPVALLPADYLAPSCPA